MHYALDAVDAMSSTLTDASAAAISPNVQYGVGTVGYSRSAMGMSTAALRNAATSSGDINIVVQSVLDGKVIGETAYKYSRNKQRAYGM